MKTIIHPKTDYLRLLMENLDWLTANEISESYFCDVAPSTARKALTRLYKQGCARRQKEGKEYRYWITTKGIMRYNYLRRKSWRRNEISNIISPAFQKGVVNGKNVMKCLCTSKMETSPEVLNLIRDISLSS